MIKLIKNVNRPYIAIEDIFNAEYRESKNTGILSKVKTAWAAYKMGHIKIIMEAGRMR
jgi:hypothetical protein